jgi:hypothetical protein
MFFAFLILFQKMICNHFSICHNVFTQRNRQPSFMKKLSILILVIALGLISGTFAAAQTVDSPQALANGSTVGPFSDAQGTLRYFSLVVPTGATAASFSITAASGDCDLYVKRGSAPSYSSWDQRPYLNDGNESVSLANPTAGTYYVMLHAYSAVQSVRLTVSHSAPATTTPPTTVAATPTFTTSPGTYEGQVSVGLSSTTPNAVIRFTTNGSTPTAASEVYNTPIVLTRTTTIRAITFATGQRSSVVRSGTFTIRGGLISLTNNVARTNLAAARGTRLNFKFAVPAGQSEMSIRITARSGDADLYVKYGQLATTSNWDQRPYLNNSNETVIISQPAAGDYFIMINAYTAFSGLSITAVHTGASAPQGLPDLMFHPGTMNPRITTETFSANSCEIQEGTITAGTHKLLRFSTETRNIGTGDLVLGNPSTNPNFNWGSCHGHYHFNSFAQYRLLDASGRLVRTGHKVGFCLMDITRHNSSANPSPRYTCSNQGIQAGWSDIYSSSLSGQWIVITGLPAGNYILEVEVDPMGLITESDETNNITRVNVTIP